MMLIVYAIMYLSLFVGIFFIYTFLENKERLVSKTSTETPKVSILIPAYNEEKNIAKTLTHLLNLDYPKNKLEIIVVDDGSKDNTAEEVKKFKSVKLLQKENQGRKAYTINYGLKHCTGEFIWMLDADCYTRPDVLRKLISYFEDPKIAAVVPAITVHDPKTFWEKVQVIEYAIGSFQRQIMYFNNAHIYANAAPLVRADFIKKYGGLDTSTIGEDLELGLRIQSKGYNLGHALDAIVETTVPGKFKSIFRQRVRWTYGLFQNLKKYGFLFGPKHGDLGMFALPITLIFPMALIFLFFRIIFETINKFAFGAALLSGIDYNVSYALYTTKYFTITYKLSVFLAVALVALGLLMYFLVKKRLALHGKFRIPYVFYIFIYLWILGIFQIVGLARWIINKPPRW